MLCTDSLEDLAADPALKATQCIAAEDIYIVGLGYPVPKVFEPNRRLCITLRPQKRRALSADGNAGMLSFRSLGSTQNEIASDFGKPNRVGLVVNHECRERVGSIQRDVPALLNRGTNIQAVSLQSRKKPVSVRLGRENNHCIPGLQSGADELTEGFQKTGIIRIEPCLVAAGDLYGLRLQRCGDLIAWGASGGWHIRSFRKSVACKSAPDKPLAAKNSSHSCH